MVTENGEVNEVDTGEEIAEEIADEIADVIEESDADTGDDIDVEIEVNEAPEIPETSYVDVGDLHISGPPEMVERVTQKYLKDHLDHNPHGEAHTPDNGGGDEGLIETATPDVVQDVIEESVSSETVDAPPGPSDWLFRERGGQ